MIIFCCFETPIISGHTCRRLAGLGYVCAYAGRTSPRAGPWADPPRVRLSQAGMAVEHANEQVHLASRKGPRNAESTRSCTPAMTLVWVYAAYIYAGYVRSRYRYRYALFTICYTTIHRHRYVLFISYNRKSISRVQFPPSAHTRGDFFLHKK